VNEKYIPWGETVAEILWGRMPFQSLTSANDIHWNSSLFNHQQTPEGRYGTSLPYTSALRHRYSYSVCYSYNEQNETTVYLLRSVTEKTSKKPSPDLIYCSLIALNSSWPAVSNTVTRTLHVDKFLTLHSDSNRLQVSASVLKCRNDTREYYINGHTTGSSEAQIRENVTVLL